VLTVAPPHPIKLYIESFDTDDPTADTSPVDDEANEEDNRGTSPAKAGQFTGESGGVLELVFPENVKTTNCEFQVTMQPGDNFRIVANGDKDFLLRMENKDSTQNVGASDAEKNANKQRICNMDVTGTPAEREIRHAGNYASDVLTVWRFLHVEVDSMGPVTNNVVVGNITGISGNSSAATNLALDINLRTGLTPQDNSANLSTFPQGNGRFENGEIRIGADEVLTAGLLGNGDIFVTHLTGFNIPAEIAQGGATSAAGQVVSLAGNTFAITGDLGTNSYSGATLVVAGTAFTISGNASNTVTVGSTAQIPFALHDDDDDTILPSGYNLGVLSSALAEAYIAVLDDGGGMSSYNQTTNTFIANLPGTIMVDDQAAFDRQASGMDHFWVAYLLMSFQYVPDSDQDADNEFGTGGVAWSITSNTGVVPGGQGSQTFAETVRDRLTSGATAGLRDRVLAHEIGHQMGLAHWDTGEPGVSGVVPINLMLRSMQTVPNSDAKFVNEHLHLIRSRQHTPGQ
jgi:hypothetical protein